METCTRSHDLRILIVDQAPDASAFAKLLSASRGVDVRVVDAGKTALAISTDWQPGVLVTELYLPDMTAFKLASLIRWGLSGRQTLKVIAATSRARLQDRLRASEAGFDAFLRKPVAPDALLGAVGGLPVRSLFDRGRLMS